MIIVSFVCFQFVMMMIFYYFFVLFLIGMVFVVVVMEMCYVQIKDLVYWKMIKFWGNIFFLSFVVGVVIGLI